MKSELSDDDECVLLEFPKESNHLAVGYKCWLKKSSSKDDVSPLPYTDDEIQVKIK